MPLRVYNTLSGEKEAFEPITPGKVGIYLCGPTVYKPAHIGHAVGPVIFDAIKRYLTYRGFKVTWVVNVTDVEDKLIVEAGKQGRSVPDLARDLEKQYVDVMKALGVTSIDLMPRASEHIKEIIEHIQALIKRGVAYPVEGDVYFDVSKDADYGKLSHRSPEEQFAGTREGLVKSAKRNPGDFALWKAAKPDEPADVQYDSPWSKGRPGWHIECSAMAMKYLGQTFDIHGGGLDLKFPHHENEIAQAESCTDKPFAKYWLHHGLTRFNTKKISKSDPDFEKVMTSLQLKSLLSKHPPELLRFLILQSQYRSPIDFSDDSLASAKTGLDSLYRVLDRLQRVTGTDPYEAKLTAEPDLDTKADALIAAVTNERTNFVDAMDDDFNTAGAIGSLFNLAGLINKFIDERKLEAAPEESARQIVRKAGEVFVFLGRLLGLFLTKPVAADLGDSKTADLVGLLIDVRKMAREAKQFQIGDHVRNKLAELGIILEDRPDGTQWRMQ
jgi:cysteinyl-tRNA synthetase